MTDILAEIRQRVETAAQDETGIRVKLRELQQEAATWPAGLNVNLSHCQGVFSGGLSLHTVPPRKRFGFFGKVIPLHIALRWNGGFDQGSEWYRLEEIPSCLFKRVKDMLPEFLEGVRDQLEALTP